MRRKEDLSRFVSAAMTAGASPQEIMTSLAQAGWDRRDAEREVAAWRPGPGAAVPVASTGGRLTAVPWVILLATLVMTICNVMIVSFWVVDAAINDPSHYMSAYAAPRWAVASLIVMAPISAYLAARNHREGPAPAWFMGLLMTTATLTLIGDAISAVYAVLAGDVSLRFVAKSLIVAAIALLTLSCRKSGDTRVLTRSLGVIAAVFSVMSIVFAGGLGEGRKERRDMARMNDLSNMSMQAVCLEEYGGFDGTFPMTPECPAIVSTADPFTKTPYAVSLTPEGLLTICAVKEARSAPSADGVPEGCVRTRLKRDER